MPQLNSEQRSSVPWLVPLGFMCLGVAGALHLNRHWAYTIDDAYITFRVARNWVQGLGLVYNPGEYVKGYSNTLLTLLSVIPETLGWDAARFSKGLGAAGYAYTLWACGRAMRTRGRLRGDLLALIGVTALVASAPLAVHAVSGLETGLYTALLVGGVQARLREQISGGPPHSLVPLCLAVLSRPEAILLVLAVTVHDVAYRAIVRRRVRARDVLTWCAPVIAYSAELWWSYLYYGRALPQTYYAKVGQPSLSSALLAAYQSLAWQWSSHGYLLPALRTTLFGALTPAILAIGLAGRAHRREALCWVSVVIAQLVFVLDAQFDWMPAARFLSPAMPFAILLTVHAVDGLAARLADPHRTWGLLLFSSLLLLALLPPNLATSKAVAKERRVDAGPHLRSGARLSGLVAPGLTLATYDIGGRGYAAESLAILDTMGLVTPGTTGCRYGMLPRCLRYAELAAPELVRRHNGHEKDEFIYRPLRASRQYLVSRDLRILLAKRLILQPQVPRHATRPRVLKPTGDPPISIAGWQVPPTARPSERLSAVLFLQRGQLPHPRLLALMESRALGWRPANAEHEAEHPARATRTAWSRLGSTAAWGADQTFSDRIRLTAPAKPGDYHLVLTAGEHTLTPTDPPIALRVVAKSMWAVEGRRLIARARQLADADPPAAQVLAQAALSLDPSPTSRELHDRLAIRLARLVAGPTPPQQPLSRLRALQGTARILRRAASARGRASPALRRALHHNARARERLMRKLSTGDQPIPVDHGWLP